MNTTNNNVVAALVNNKEENKMNTTINYNGLELQGEKALVLYNRVSKEDIRWGQLIKTDAGTSQTMSLLQKDLEKEVDLTDFKPVFQLDKKMWSVKQAGMQDFLLPTLSVEEFTEVMKYASDNVKKESSYVETLIKEGVRVFDGRTGVKVELSGNSNEVVYATYDNLLLNDTVEAEKLISMQPGYISVSSNRAGSADSTS